MIKLEEADRPHETVGQAIVAQLQAKIDAAGLQLVPKVPTEKMLKAAAESKAVDDEGPRLPLFDYIDCSPSLCRTIVKAALTDALDAAPTTKLEDLL